MGGSEHTVPVHAIVMILLFPFPFGFVRILTLPIVRLRTEEYFT